MRFMPPRGTIRVCAVLAMGLLPLAAKADTPTTDGFDPLSQNPGLSSPDMVDRPASEPIAIPLPTAAQSGMMVFGAAALWRGVRRIRSAA